MRGRAAALIAGARACGSLGGAGGLRCDRQGAARLPCARGSQLRGRVCGWQTTGLRARGGVFVRTARCSRGQARDAVSWWGMVERRRGKDGIRGAGVSADNASGDGGARLGSGGFCVRVGRRVRRPSLVRNCHYHAAFRGARLPRGRDRAARLERSGVGCGVRRAASGVPRLGRQHGLDGKPLHGGEEAPPRRCVLAGR